MSLLYLPLYVGFLTLSFLTGLVPRRLGHAGAWILGTLAYFLMPSRRRVMADNYAPVLGVPPADRAIRRVGLASYRNYVKYLYDVFVLPHRSVDEIDGIVDLHVSDDVVDALAMGKGMVFVSAHFGNLDYTAVALAKHLVPITVVADMLKSKQIMDRLVDFRGKKGVNVVYLARAPRAILTALKRNESVGFLVDVGCNRDGGVPVTFFGRRSAFPAGPALLALRTGTAVVVGYSVNVGGRIQAYSYPPVFVTPTGNKEQDVARASQLIANHFEDFIRRYPEQWYMYRRMWGSEDEAETGCNPLPAAMGDATQIGAGPAKHHFSFLVQQVTILLP